MRIHRLTILTVILLALAVPFAVAYTGPVNITGPATINDTRVDPNATIAFTIPNIFNGSTNNPVQNGFGMQFDGTSDYLNISDAASLRVVNLTLEAWVRPNATQNAEAGIVTKRHSALNRDSYGLKWDNINDRFIVQLLYGVGPDTITLTGPTITNFNAVNYIVATFDNSTLTASLYLNNTLVDTDNTATSGLLYDAYDLTIATEGEFETVREFTGFIDEVRIYNRTLGSGERAYNFENKVPLNQDRLELWIDFDTNVLDQTANGNDADIQGNPEFIRGIRGKADIVLDGTGDYVRVLDDNSLDIEDSITIEAWVKPENVAGIMNIISKGDTWGQIFGHNGFNFYFYLVGVHSWAHVTTVNLYDGAPHHVVGTWDNATGMRLYFDGAFDDLENRTGKIATGLQDVIIGARQDGAASLYNGTIGEVRVYNRTLTSLEVLQHYQGTYLNESGLVGFWNMDGNVLDISGEGNNGAENGDPEYSDGWAYVPVFTSINGTTVQLSSLVNSSTGILIGTANAPGVWGNHTANVYAETNSVQNATVLVQVDEYVPVLSAPVNPVEINTRARLNLLFTSKLDGHIAGPGSTAIMDSINFAYSAGLLTGLTPRQNQLITITYGNVTSFNENTYGITNFVPSNQIDVEWGIPFSTKMIPSIELMITFFPLVVLIFALGLIELGRLDYISNRVVIYALVVAVAAIILTMYQALGA